MTKPKILKMMMKSLTPVILTASAMVGELVLKEKTPKERAQASGARDMQEKTRKEYVILMIVMTQQIHNYMILLMILERIANQE